MLSSTLSRMGCEKLGSMPGIVWSDAFMRSIRRSFVTPRGHSASGRTSTRNSAMLIIFGSVPSSGRPAFERTETTSGNRRSIPRIRASCRDVSVTEMPGGNMTLIQSAPSLSSGRNSVPNAGTSRRLPASAATAAPRTILRRSGAMMFAAFGETPEDVLQHDDRPVDDDPEVHRAERQQVRRDGAKPQADERREQRQRNDDRDDACRPEVAQEQVEHDRHQQRPL